VVNRIAYVCAPEQAQSIERAFEEFETKDVSGERVPLSIYRAAVVFRADLVMVFDCGMPDEQIVELATRAKNIASVPEVKGMTLPKVAFVGDALREPRDPIYTELYRAGVTYMAGPIGKAGYDMYASALDLVVNGPRTRYRAHVMGFREFADAQTNMIAGKDALEETERIHKMISICVFQSADRNGSTHLSIAIASSLRAINYRTALVLPERHFIELKECFPNSLSVLADGGYNFFGIGIYPGETASLPNAVDYDYIVLDQGTVSWFKTKNRSKKQQSEYREFNQANIAVWSSFMTPTGQWSLTVPDENGVRALTDFTTRSSLPKIRFAIFGIEDEEIALASEQIQKVAKREISLVGIEPFINPFLTIRGSSRRIPASISKLLGTGIVTKETARSLESYIKAQREFDASILEPVREPEKKQSFLSRFFGKWDGGR